MGIIIHLYHQLLIREINLQLKLDTLDSPEKNAVFPIKEGTIIMKIKVMIKR